MQRLEVYGHMLALASQHSPAVRQGLEEIGMAHHDLALIYLQGAAGADFMKALHRLLERDPNLQMFSSEERVKFFSLWAERGDRKELLSAVEAQPDWMKDAWRSVAKDHASGKGFRDAFELVRRFGQAPPLPEAPAGPSIDQLRQAFHANPDNYGAGFQLYHEQMRLGRTDEALMTVRHFTAQPAPPSYFHFLEAEAWAAKENWERAWKAWEKFDAARKQ